MYLTQNYEGLYSNKDVSTQTETFIAKLNEGRVFLLCYLNNTVLT